MSDTTPASSEDTTPAADPDRLIGHVFDQTNGVADGLDGDSDGSAASDLLDGARRDDADPTFDDAEVVGDDEGVHDLRDPNP